MEDFLFRPPYFAKDVVYRVVSARHVDESNEQITEVVLRIDDHPPPHLDRQICEEKLGN